MEKRLNNVISVLHTFSGDWHVNSAKGVLVFDNVEDVLEHVGTDIVPIMFNGGNVLYAPAYRVVSSEAPDTPAIINDTDEVAAKDLVKKIKKSKETK